MIRSERLIKLSNSWFFVKFMKVKRLAELLFGRVTCCGARGAELFKPWQTPKKKVRTMLVSQTMGAKVRSQEGNSPD